ncbi:hypothetical Protein YC6258_00518 [Gynuella sunshinyii YC6258]|uniref:Uncharacterized protein n=1 Tax=Gynuella sunshinyii YC6258 TaxID=1445510 RepID=A0A0C5VGQ5_9GAMM|nr:hypothetical Protein YC6258_00518 [Gynuella sunshinyii YC6258]
MLNDFGKFVIFYFQPTYMTSLKTAQIIMIMSITERLSVG